MKRTTEELAEAIANKVFENLPETFIKAVGYEYGPWEETNHDTIALFYMVTRKLSQKVNNIDYLDIFAEPTKPA